MTGQVDMLEVGGRLILRLPPRGSWSETMALVERALEGRMGGAPARVVLDSGPVVLATEQLLQVEGLLHKHGCNLVKVIHGPAEGEARAEQESRETGPAGRDASGGGGKPEPRGRAGRRWTRSRETGERPRPEERAGVDRQHSEEWGGRTLIRRGPIRSGQVIRYEGNVVILGDVNPGAEIVAAGDVVVMGTLRGVAHAGATGNRQAVVAALRLCPTQLRIADLIGRAPEDNYGDPMVPELARVRDTEIFVEAL